MNNYKRRNYLINKSLQLRYISMTAILMVIISIIIGWAIYSTTWGILFDKLEGITALDELFIDLSSRIFIRTCSLILSGVCLATLIVMFVVHRVAGPLFRVKRTMDRIAAGVIPHRLKFRKRDELQDIAKAIDGAIQKIGEMSRQNLNVVEQSSASVQKVKQLLALEKPNIQEADRELDNLAKRLQEFETFRKEEDE